LSKISGIFGQYNISIKSVIQKSRHADEPVHIVLRSHSAWESDVEKALNEIDSLEICTAPTMKIRVLVDDED
jgi:homoserine dehydrogenase